MKKILLMGNPNVGKSVIFNRLTGVDVIVSNYPGTTVEFTKGNMRIGDEKFEVIDVPGTYTLEPTSKAEEVAVEILNEGDIVINVIEATNLERSLNLTLQLIKRKIPILIALNFWDEAKHIGISIDVEKLEQILGVPCITTCALTGEGIKKLVQRLVGMSFTSTYEYEESERWHEIGNIIAQVEKVTHRHHTFLERLGDASVAPFTGILIALIVLYVTFSCVRFMGEGLKSYIFDPIFEKFWAPLMIKFSALLGRGIIHDILIGKLIGRQIDFIQSLGLLTTGLYVEFAMVLPYVFAFYVVLSFLEDLGYLPRLSILVDTIMHRGGLHGLAIIPMMLGLGCNVPAVLSTRIMETKKERFISSTLIAISVPCIAKTAMIVGLIGKYGVKGLAIVFGTLFFVLVVLGILFNRLVKGEVPEIFVEIPPYRIPYLRGLAQKVWIRIKWFIREATPWVLVGVFIINILYTLHIIEFIGKFTAPVISKVWGLPPSAVAALLVGFLRKDVAVGMLAPLGLTLKQLIVAAVVLSMYFPCAATFTTLAKELGVKDILKSASIMLISALIVGGLLNLILF